MNLLTPRQHEILRFISEGLTSAEIAKRLHRSVRTVESHRLKIGQRLGAKSPTELLIKARQAGLLPAEDNRVFPEKAAGFQSLENILMTLGHAARSAEDGIRLLQNICSQMGAAFGVRAAVISRVTEHGTVQSVASWSACGQLTPAEWDLKSSPCSRLKWSEIATIRCADLPVEMRRAFAPICQGMRLLTILPLHREVDVHVGVLCLVHDGELDANGACRPLLQLCSAWIASELYSSICRDDLIDLGFQFGALEEHSQSVTFRCRADGTLVWISSRCQQVLGSSIGADSTLDLHALLESITGSADDRRVEQISERLKHGRSFSAVFRCRKSDRGWPRVHMTLQLIPGGGSEASDFIGVIDFAKSSTNTLKDSADSGALQLLVSKHPDPCVLVQASGEIIAASASWRDLLYTHSIPPGTVSTNYLSVLSHITDPAQAESVRTTLSDLLEGMEDCPKQPLMVHAKLPSSESATESVAIELTPIPDTEGVFIRHRSAATNDDPSAGKRAAAFDEDSHEEVSGEVSSAWPADTLPARTFDWMFTHTPHVMCVCTLDGILLRVNPSFCQAFEGTKQSLTGIRYATFFYPNDRPYMQELVGRLISGKPIEQVVFPMRTLNNNRVLIEWTCPPVLPGTDIFTPIGRVM